MDTDQYNNLLLSVYEHIDTDELNRAISYPKPQQRIDAVQDLIRDAISKSSIGKYKGVPCFFNGKIYEEVSPDKFGDMIYELMKKCDLPIGDYSRVDSIIRVCKRVISWKEYNPDRSIMVFRNCVLDTKSRSVHDFSPSFVQMSSIGYDYDPGGIPLQWNQFMDSVLPETEEKETLQEALGCLLINRRESKMEHITFLYGTGANGKSVVFETVVGLFGRDNISNYPLNSLIGGGDRKKNIASMDGKWANYSPESQQVDISRNEDGFKSLTSGEPTEARQIYGENFMAYNIPLQFANINRYPEIRSMSGAVRRRIVIINFNVEIPVHKQDKRLARVFESEYSGILNWIMDGRDRFIANGYEFTHRNKIDQRLEEYQYECNSVLRFMTRMKYYRADKNMVDATPRYVSSTILYRKYFRWCEANDIQAENSNVFGCMLSDGGYTKKRLSGGYHYALFGKAVLDQIEYKNVAGKRRTNREKNVPFMQDGRKYVISYRGLSDEIKVTFNTISSWMKLGLMEGTYMKAGSRFLFDVAKVLDKIKSSDLLQSDVKRDKANYKRVKGESKRGQVNNTMKKYGSNKRVYKSPVIDAIATDQTFLSGDEIDRMVDG